MSTITHIVDRRSWLRNGIVKAMVLGILGGLAYAGHRGEWRLPTFASLVGERHADKDDWCAAHAVPESQCVECNPNVASPPPHYGWCKTHGVHDCPLEHPDVAQTLSPPTVTAEDRQRARRGLATAKRPENNPLCKHHQRRIQFASMEAFQHAAIDPEPVTRAAMVEFVSANGEVIYDRTLLAHLSSRAPGTIWRMDKQVGDHVKQGEVIALIDAAEVGRAKGEFLRALVQVRLKTRTVQLLREGGRAVAGRRLQEAEAELSEARIRLLSARQTLVNLGLPLSVEELEGLSERQLATYIQFLGLPTEVRQTLDAKTTTANLLPVKAPLDGVVVARDMVAGEVVDTSTVLLAVADVRRMWLMLNVRQEDAVKLLVGQPVRFRIDGDVEEVSGAVDWISTAVDEKTRTVQVRVALANLRGRLRAHSFGKGRIILREEKDAIVVPNEAVHWEGDCFVVFVRDKDFLKPDGLKIFHTRNVRPGAKNDKYTEIIAGVLPGEVVAAKGSGVLRSELLKNNLGEG